MQETITKKIDSKSAEKISATLVTQGYTRSPGNTVYEGWRLKKGGVNITYYLSGKLVIQGKNLSDEKDLSGLVEASASSSSTVFTTKIGADEVGKGDYFGPLVVAAAYISQADLPFLKEIGVGDSKKISDAEILNIFSQLKDKIKYRTQIIEPAIYNELYASLNNVAILLSKFHARNIEELLKELELSDNSCKLVVIDQFSTRKDRMLNELLPLTRKLKFEQFHKGESDIAVAAASIIARATFVLAWEDMEKEWGFKFPKGATNVISAGKLFVKQFGKEKLSQVAKISFRTTGEII